MNREPSWKDVVAADLAPELAREIEVFETELELKRRGRIDDKLFAETRLRRGAYGQRYDNGKRNDGTRDRQLAFPEPELTKGPGTVWHAPGMQRIKLPTGKMSVRQLVVLAELAEEVSDGILHVTTRQDIQLHYVHLEDTPDMMRRLGAVGLTTREACGNSVRNVTQCPYAGTCGGEPFDTTPHAFALTWFLMGHEDTFDFGRKVKIAFSGCRDGACGLVGFHDLGAIALMREVDGVAKRGFELWVGGGLGAVPQPAKLLEEWVPEEELLPVSQAVARVFGRLGEKDNRSRARIKFLIKKLGIEEFQRLVREERKLLRPDPRWTAHLGELSRYDETPVRPAAPLPSASEPELARFIRNNVKAQRQEGYCSVKVQLPLGDFTADQARGLARLVAPLVGDAMRLTVDQSVVLRFVSGADIAALYRGLVALGLGEAGADTITDITSCPGTDTCKLGISSSRGLSRELRRQLTVLSDAELGAAKDLHVKCSGCFNSCGQHHVADIGLLGVSRNVGGRRVPHFQLVVGGELRGNGFNHGLAIGAVPSKRAPELVRRLAQRFASERQGQESFRVFVERIGKKEIRKLVDELSPVPSYEVEPGFYSDWGDPREYTIGDMGVGECAGEVVGSVEMALAAAEREVFEAQLLLDQSDWPGAVRQAIAGMSTAARALAREADLNISTEQSEVLASFRKHLVDTGRFHDPFVGLKFAQYYFRAVENPQPQASADATHQLIEEAGLFIEAAHQCRARQLEALAALAASAASSAGGQAS